MRLKFDDRVFSDEQVKEINFVLKARCETVVKVPTDSELKIGLISKTADTRNHYGQNSNCSMRGRTPYQHFEHE